MRAAALSVASISARAPSHKKPAELTNAGLGLRVSTARRPSCSADMSTLAQGLTDILRALGISSSTSFILLCSGSQQP